MKIPLSNVFVAISTCLLDIIFISLGPDCYLHNLIFLMRAIMLSSFLLKRTVYHISTLDGSANAPDPIRTPQLKMHLGLNNPVPQLCILHANDQGEGVHIWKIFFYLFKITKSQLQQEKTHIFKQCPFIYVTRGS